MLLVCESILMLEMFHRQDNIFKPLDIKASFYLTPDIKERLVDLTFRRGNNLEAWSDQSRIIERDPLKRNETLLRIIRACTYQRVSLSSMPHGWCGVVLIVEGFSYSAAPYTKDHGYVNVVSVCYTLSSIGILPIAGTASNSIISPGTVESIFEPALNDQSTKPLDRFLSMDPFTPTSGTQWTAGGFALSSSDLPGRRKKGSGFCMYIQDLFAL